MLTLGAAGCVGLLGPADLMDNDAGQPADGSSDQGMGWDAGDGDAHMDTDGDATSFDADQVRHQDGDGDATFDEPDSKPAPWDGWIGSPCRDADDCSYDDSLCLDALPEGTCSLPCERTCPDRDGFPVTFCVDGLEVPDEAGGFVDGACFSRCDYGLFPGTGCREGYGCVPASRSGEPDVERYVCLPGHGEQLSPCQEALAELGVRFEPADHQPEHPSSHPSLTCIVDDPVIIHPPIHGVDLVSSSGATTANVFASCAMAHALVATIDDVAPYGVTALRHMGTYNCRVIAGTDRLSRHAYGDALDIYGFDFEDGALWTLVHHWEHGTADPVTEAGAFLYDAAYRWHDARIWNIILTPNYNSAHDDHFHIDLTPGSDFIRHLRGPYYIGPAPYAD